ncbi:MAG: TerB family tellurite resistance protein [Mesorhizobium sp.]|nr:TerB family tellurite resistance protein [Mesorhizobium sp.]
MSTGIIERIRVLFEGDPAVRRVADDPVLTAELMLLFRMVLADGEAAEPEMAAFRRICRDAFGIGEESLKQVVAYLQDFGYETTEPRALGAFGGLPLHRRIELARHMAEIAKADQKLSKQEVDLLKRTISILHVDPMDVVGPPR